MEYVLRRITRDWSYAIELRILDFFRSHKGSFSISHFAKDKEALRSRDLVGKLLSLFRKNFFVPMVLLSS